MGEPRRTYISYDNEPPIMSDNQSFILNPPIKLKTKERLRRMRDQRVRK